MIQNEILMAMLGFEGEFFIISPEEKRIFEEENKEIYYYSKPPEFICNEHHFKQCESTLSQSEKTAINKLVRYGGHIVFLKQFVARTKNKCHDYYNTWNSHLSSSKTREKPCSLYIQAISSSISRALEHYECKILEIERLLLQVVPYSSDNIQDQQQQRRIGISFLHAQFFSLYTNDHFSIDWIPQLSQFVASVNEHMMKIKKHFDDTGREDALNTSKYVLEMINNDYNDDLENTSFFDMKYHCNTLLLSQILHWMELGDNNTMNGLFDEFFIQQTTTLCEEGANPENTTFILIPSRVPTSIISLETAQQILFIGKAVQILEKYNKTVKEQSTWISPISHLFHEIMIKQIMNVTEGNIGYFKNHPKTITATELNKNHENVLNYDHYLSPSISVFASHSNLPLLLRYTIHKLHEDLSQKLYNILLHNNQKSGSSQYCSNSRFNLIDHMYNIRNTLLLGYGQFFTLFCKECDSQEIWTKSLALDVTNAKKDENESRNNIGFASFQKKKELRDGIDYFQDNIMPHTIQKLYGEYYLDRLRQYHTFTEKNNYFESDDERTKRDNNNQFRLLDCLQRLNISISQIPPSLKSNQYKNNNTAIKFAIELHDNFMDTLSDISQKEIYNRIHKDVVAKITWLDGGDGGSAGKLLVDYDLPFPYTLIITKKSIQTIYNSIFHRILAIQRAIFEINDCWKIMMDKSGHQNSLVFNSDRLWLAPLWAIRQKVFFFLNNLLQYFQLNVIDSSFHQIISQFSYFDNGENRMKAKSIGSFQDIQAAHAKFVSALRRGCFLDSEVINNLLKKILTIALRLTTIVRYMASSSNSENDHGEKSSSAPMAMSLANIPTAEISRLSRMFDEETSKLFQVLQETSSNANELCARLDFNGWFSSGPHKT